MAKEKEVVARAFEFWGRPDIVAAIGGPAEDVALHMELGVEIEPGELWAGIPMAGFSMVEVGALFSLLSTELSEGRTSFALALPFVRRVIRRRIPGVTKREPVSTEDRALVLAAGRCRVCGDTDDLQVDHIHPVAMGGTSERGNLQALCRPCNLDKRDKPMDVWLATRAGT